MIAIFRKDIIAAGGIETWLYYLAKRYGKTHDITIYYKRADPKQLHRLSKLVRCIKYNGQDIECDKAIYCYDFMGLSTTHAREENIHIVHADYEEINLQPNIPDKIDKIYGVSKIACKSFTKITGLECEVAYNLLELDTPQRVLKLVSATRLSEEKGLWRIRELARALDAAGVKYTWDIYTPNPQPIDSPSVSLKSPRLDVIDFVAAADYLVQLSDTESFGYSIVEALSMGTPVITTNIPVLKELGVNNRHGVIIDLDEESYETYIGPITEASYDFSYDPPKDKWDDILGPATGSTYDGTGFLVESLGPSTYYVEEDITLGQGKTMVVFDEDRVKHLVDNGYVKLIKE